MSKTPKATNLEEATLAPTTGTQKKAPKVSLTMDPDYDEEEGKEKVPLEKPNEKKATKSDWTDKQKAALWKLRDAVVEAEEDKNASDKKTVNMTNVWNRALVRFKADENGRADVSVDNISQQHSKLKSRQNKTNTNLLKLIKEQPAGCPYKDNKGTLNTGETEASAKEYVANLWWTHRGTVKPKEFVFADYEDNPLFEYFWEEKLVFIDARFANACAVDTQKMFKDTQKMFKLERNDQSDSDLGAEDDIEEDEAKGEGAPQPGGTSQEAPKRKQEREDANKKKKKPNTAGVSRGNAARRADTRSKAIEEQIKLKAKAHEEVQMNVLNRKEEMTQNEHRIGHLKEKLNNATSEKKKRKYKNQLNQLLGLAPSSSEDEDD